jgi:hypothetical protein
MFLKLHQLRCGRRSRPDAWQDKDLIVRDIKLSEVPLDLIYIKSNFAQQVAF